MRLSGRIGALTVERCARSRWKNATALFVIVAIAGLLRFEGIAWDDGILPHPDERYLAMVASALNEGKLTDAGRDAAQRGARQASCAARNPGTAGVGGWFDTECSDFNPANVGHPNYPYGQLPLASVRLAAEAVATATGDATLRAYGGIQLVGRALSAVADILTLLVPCQLGRLLWGRAVGLLGAAFYAVAVLPIQAAHFFTVDSWVTLFASVALLFAVRLARFGHRADALAFGAAFGLALATKVSIAPLVLLLPLAAYWAPPRIAFAGRPDWLTRVAILFPELLLAAFGALITFRFAAPYAFAGPAWHDFLPAPSFVDAVLESRRLASGDVDIPPNWQWLGRTPWLWPAQNQIVWGLGIPLGLVVVAGLACRGWRLLRATRVERARALVWLWGVGMFVWLGQQWVASMRYFLPLYPVACLFAAGWLLPWWRAGRIAAVRHRGPTRSRSLVPAVLAGGVLLATMAWAFAFHQVHTTLHPYAAATAWVLRTVPAPVSADLSPAAGAPTLVNWPAAGEFRADAPPRIAATTVAPASGRIEQLRLHQVLPAGGDGALRFALRVLDADGRELASTGVVELAVNPAGAAALRDVGLPLQPAVALVGGRSYRVAVDVTHGAFALSGAKIAHEGAWNDSVPTRVKWPAPAAALDLAGPSGRVARDAEGVDPFAAGYYVPLDLGLATEDDAAKKRRLSAALAEAEWLIVPNRRFYDAMPRNAARFPLTTWFYDALFAGELGFERTLTVASLPRLFGIAVDDQALPAAGVAAISERSTAWAAEEAFSVYDHPTVFVFRRGDDAPHRIEAALRDAPPQLASVGEALTASASAPALAGRLGWSTRSAAGAPDALMQRSPPPAGRSPTAAGDDPGGAATFVAIAGWYLVTLFLAWVAWPWLALLWPALADRGYGVARIAGLAAAAAVGWWATWLGWPLWSQAGLAAVVGAGAAGTVALGWRFRHRLRALLHERRADIATVEALYAALFALGLVLRALDPDLWAPAFGGEKPMDYAYFNSVLAASTFPPPDPWFSGGRMNYYYFGWVLAAVPTKLLGTAAGLAYNLALGTWFALTGTAAYALASNAVRTTRTVRAGRIAGGVALAATVLIGNLDLPRTLAGNVAALGELAGAAQPSDPAAWRAALTRHAERWYWAPSRTVGERRDASFEINEFPAFSFLQGDLHPHLLAWPLHLFVLTALFALLAAEGGGRSQHPGRLFARMAVAAVAVGLLRATNSWDWPLYLALASAAVAVAGWRRGEALVAKMPERFRVGRRVALTVAFVAALVVVQAVAAAPFATSFVTGALALRLYEGSRTPLWAWLAMHGWFVLVIGGWAWTLARDEGGNPTASPRARAPCRALRWLRWCGCALTVASAIVVLGGGGGEVEAVGLQIALVAWLAEVFVRQRGRDIEQTGLALAVAGFGLALAVEFIVVGQDIGRMNTYFKFHLQSWMLLALAAGIAAAGLVARGVPRRSGRAFGTVVGVASAVALAYLPLGAYGRLQARFDPAAPVTLDGEAFLGYAVLDHGGTRLALAGDAALFGWLRAHAGAQEVVLEAQLPEYRWGSRISSFTGLPTLLGYRHHQTQQRPVAALGEAIELRRRNVAAIYATSDAGAAMAALQHYRVRYVVVGGLERASYPEPGIAKFAALAAAGSLEPAFVSGADVIYRVPQPAEEARGWVRW